MGDLPIEVLVFEKMLLSFLHASHCKILVFENALQHRDENNFLKENFWRLLLLGPFPM